MVKQYPNQIAGLIAERGIADTIDYTPDEIAEAQNEINKICRENGIVYIVMIVTGYRSGFPHV